MESNQDQLASLFPNIAAQLKSTLGTLQLAAQQLATPAAREENPRLDAQAAQLDQSYYRLLRMVNNLSAAEYLTSDAPLPLENTELAAFALDIFNKAESLASQIGLEMQFICPKDHILCAVNRPALEQLLYHLLSNALKFTPAGGKVTVELQAKGQQVLLTVADNGPGISESELPMLFDRYLHRDQIAPPPHGLGLGLPLCRKIAQRHGGALLAQCAAGKGCRFTCALPLKQVPDKLADTFFDYSGGFNRSLMHLSDALPAKVFTIRNQG